MDPESPSPGFESDDSYSSYLFYAVDHPVSEEGQALASQFSSLADVTERSARYEKWGEAELTDDARCALLAGHYDLLVACVYNVWTLTMAFPAQDSLQERLALFAQHGSDLPRVEVSSLGPNLLVSIHCCFNYNTPFFQEANDPEEALVEALASVRTEIRTGDCSFLETVHQHATGSVNVSGVQSLAARRLLESMT